MAYDALATTASQAFIKKDVETIESRWREGGKVGKCGRGRCAGARFSGAKFDKGLHHPVAGAVVIARLGSF